MCLVITFVGKLRRFASGTSCKITLLLFFLLGFQNEANAQVSQGNSFLSILGSNQTVVSTGANTIQIEIQLFDAGGTPVSGRTSGDFNFAPSSGTDLQFTSVNELSAVPGVYRTNVSSTRAQGVTLRVTVDGVTVEGDNQGNPVTVIFVPGSVNSGQTSVQADPTSTVADGVSTITISVIPRDGFANSLGQGQGVSFAVIVGTATPLGTVVFNIGDSSYKQDFSSTVAGQVIIQATVNSVVIAQTAVISFTPGPVSSASTDISASPAAIFANGTDVTTIIVFPKDSNGNKRGLSENVTIENSDGGVFLDPSAILNASDSSYTRRLRAPTSPGKDTVSVTVNGVNIVKDPPVLIRYIGAISPTQTSVNAGADEIVADGQSSTSIAVVPRDITGNVIPGLGMGDVTISTTKGTLLGVVQTVNDTTYVQTLQSSTVAGLAIISVKVKSVNIANKDTVEFIPGPISSGVTILTASPTTIKADNVSRATLSTIPKDAFGNNIGSGQVVMFSVLPSGNAQLVGTVVNDNDTSYVQQLQAGSIPSTITVRATINSILINQQAAIVLLGPVNSNVSTVIAASDTLVADGEDTTSVTVVPKDVNGVELGTGQTVTLNTSLGTFLSDVVDGGDGSYTQVLQTGTAIGTATISAKVNDVPLSSAVEVEFIAGTVSVGQSAVVALDDSIVANGTETTTILVTPRDVNGNILIPGQGVVLSTSLAGPGGVLVGTIQDVGDGTYIQQLRSSTFAGVETITAKVNGVEIAQKALVNFIPDLANVSTSTINGDGDEHKSDGNDAAIITIVLRDQNNNLVTGKQNEGFEFSSSFGGDFDVFSDVVELSSLGTYQATLVSRGVGIDTISVVVDNSNVRFTSVGGNIRATVVFVNQNPEFDAIAAQRQVGEGELLLINVSASDPDGDPITLDAFDLPNGAMFSDKGGGIGTFEWTPTFLQAGIYNVGFAVADNRVGTDTTQVEITVQNVNGPPEFNAIPDQTVNEGQTLEFTLTAEDPDNDVLKFAVLEGLPSGASLTQAGFFRWTTNFDQAGEYSIRFIVVDPPPFDNSDEIMVRILVRDINRAPQFTGVPSAFNIQEDELLSFDVSAFDADGDSVCIEVRASDLPVGASFSNACFDSAGVVVFTWRPTFEQANTFPIRFTVSDGSISTALIVTITVGGINRKPQLTALTSPRTINENQHLEFNVSATDPDGDTFQFGVIDLPEGAEFDTTASFDSTGTELFVWTPTFVQAGDYEVSFFARDGLGAADTSTVNIVVNNVNGPPSITEINGNAVVIGDTLTFEVDEGKILELILEAEDPDDDVLRFFLSNQIINSSLIGNVFLFEPDFTQSGEFFVAFFVIDDLNSSPAVVVRLVVNEVNRAPQLSGVPAEATIDEGQLLQFTVTATDSDTDRNDRITLTASGLPTNAEFSATSPASTVTGSFSWQPTFDQSGPYEITFVASDNRGAADSTEIQISVINVSDVVGAFSLISPPDGATVTTLLPEFSWQTAIDPDPNDTVSYTLLLSTNNTFETADTLAKNRSETSFQSAIPLAINTMYFWRVIARDTRNNSTTSNVDFSFNTSNRNVSIIEIPAGGTPGPVRVSGTAVTITFTASPQGQVTVEEVFGKTPPLQGVTVDTLLIFPRFWNITGTMPQGSFSYIVDLDYGEAEIPSTIDEADLQMALYDPIQARWVQQDAFSDVENNVIMVNNIIQEFGLFAIGDFTLPQFTVALLQNPILTSNLDIFAATAQNLSTRPTISVSDENLTVSSFAADGLTFYTADFRIPLSGNFTVTVTGTDLFGNSTTIETPFSAALATQAAGARLTSYDNTYVLKLDKNSISRDTYILSMASPPKDVVEKLDSVTEDLPIVNVDEISEPSFTAASEVYRINPIGLKLDRKASLIFDLNKLELDSEDGLGIFRMGTDGTLKYVESYVDETNKTLTAYTDEMGFYVVGTSGEGMGEPPRLPNAYSMSQNYPNPFNPSTTINFTIRSGVSKETEDIDNNMVVVSLNVFDLRGRLIKTLVSEKKAPGFYSVHWNGEDETGNLVASGIYIYKMATEDGFTDVKKLVILK